MMSLGRYRSQYERPEFHPRASHLKRAHRLSPDDGLINIAEPVGIHGPEDVCTVRVYCRPKTEHELDGHARLWGVKNGTKTAIIPFEFTARLDEGRIRRLEFDVRFKSKLWQQPSNAALSEFEGDDVRLVAVPAPRSVHGRNSSSQEGSSWKLSSKPIQSLLLGYHACGAKWTWVANGQDPFYLHGAVIVKHSDLPFALTCKVRGSIDIPFWDYWPQIAFRYSFSNDCLDSRWWQLTPQPPACNEEGFQSAIDGLNAACERLNLRDGSTCKSCKIQCLVLELTQPQWTNMQMNHVSISRLRTRFLRALVTPIALYIFETPRASIREMTYSIMSSLYTTLKLRNWLRLP